MESLDDLPNLRAAIKGDDRSYPYIYFENVLASIPSGSKPVNTTLLTGLYPQRHGIPQTIWVDRQEEKYKTLTSLTQRRVVDILEKTQTDTVFDFARRSDKTTMAVTTLVTKGVEPRDWIQMSVHLIGQAFFVNLLQDGNSQPDGAHLDRGTTKGLMDGYLYKVNDGLNGYLKTTGDIPDLTVIHYAGMDIFTHYPRRFMIKDNWSIDQIQKWYLKEVLDPEIGKIMGFLKANRFLENTLFVFVADHGQTIIKEHIDEDVFVKPFTKKYKVMDQPYPLKESDLAVLPGAGTKTIYIKNRLKPDWMSPPRLLADVKPVVDVVMDTQRDNRFINTMLIAQYPGERDEGIKETDAYWFFDLDGYGKSDRRNDDFFNSLGPLSKLDQQIGEDLNAANMYRWDFSRISQPDIILINTQGSFFTPNRGKYAHHGSIYADDMYVSFVFSGPGIRRFSNEPQIITRQIHMVDLLPMAAYVSDIRVDKSIDGKNQILEVK